MILLNNKIISFINKIFRNDDITNHIAKITQTKIENLEIKIKDIQSNIFLDTATWAMGIFEKELDINYTEDKTIAERKSIISAKWRGAGKLTLELIQDTVKAYTSNVVNVKFNGTIIIDFTNKIGKPNDIDSIFKSIEDIKPAHLSVDYIFRYRTWGDLTHFNWGDINKYSWKDIKEKEI